MPAFLTHLRGAANNVPRIVTQVVTADGDGVTTTAQAGKHKWVIDEPASMGGKDSGKLSTLSYAEADEQFSPEQTYISVGTTPLSYFLGSLIGCSEVTLHTVAKQMGLEIGKVKWTVWGKLDARGLRGVQGVPARFQEIDILAEIDTTANAQQLTQLRVS